MDLYVIGFGLKLYIINRVCGGVPLSVATHVATNLALSATWWTTKQAVGLVGSGLVGTYRLLAHTSTSPSGNGINASNRIPIQQDWEIINGGIPDLDNLANQNNSIDLDANANQPVAENMVSIGTKSSTDNKNCFSELEASYIIISSELDISD